MSRLSNEYLIKHLKSYLNGLDLHDKDGFALDNLILSLEDNIKANDYELKLVYSQIRKHDRTGVLKALYKNKL